MHGFRFDVKANRIKIVHQAEKDTTDFEATITDATEIGNILRIYNSMKVRQMSKPLNIERFIISFYYDDTEIAVWWVDSELTTACSAFEGGNHVIKNKDFNYNYLEKLLKK
jgi:thiamine pyrophosphokinase